MGVIDLVSWGENYLTGNSTEVSLPYSKYRDILDLEDDSL
jgi:hypothetical protein